MSYLFGARLQELRAEAGLTLRELAHQLNTDHTYLSHIESGRRAPSEDLLSKVADYFEQDTDILRLQAGQVPERILSIMQRRPQLSLSLLGSLDNDIEKTWYYDVATILEDHPGNDQIDALTTYDRSPYNKPVDAGKNTTIYNAHSYHTKVPHQGIIPFIEHYTEPGDLIVDPFCGSGMTGVAALFAGRDAIVSDVSPAAVHIARNYGTPADPQLLDEVWAGFSRDLEALSIELYGTTCERCEAPALIEYTVFSDVFECPDCGGELPLWVYGRNSEGKLTGRIDCPACQDDYNKNDLEWLRSEPCSVNTSCTDCKTRNDRPPTKAELETLSTIARIEPPGWVPDVPFGPDWEMWRQGHADRNIRSVKDFFTPRNLHALSAIRERIMRLDEERIRQAFLFAFTGCVNRASKRYQWNHKRPTNVLSGTLYVSSLFYEFNVIRLYERKVRAALRLFGSTFPAKGRVAVHKSSATSLQRIPDESVDYVFTDPPFGSNIYYADVSLLWEAWLGDLTDRDMEMVISRSRKAGEGGKDLQAYQEMLTEALLEIRRILKPNRWATVVFHSSSADVWQAVKESCLDAGFTLGSALMFDKKQKSFKAIKGIKKGERVANFDVVLNLQRKKTILANAPSEAASEAKLVEAMREYLQSVPEDTDSDARSTAYLHSLAVQSAWTDNLDFQTIGLKRFEELLEREFVEQDGRWFENAEELNLSAARAERTVAGKE